MSIGKHTPKGWTLELGKTLIAIRSSSAGRLLSTTLASAIDRILEEQVANAHMMVASVDMYEALKAARTDLWDDWHSHMSLERFEAEPLILQIDAAISKAEGRA